MILVLVPVMARICVLLPKVQGPAFMPALLQDDSL
jgi:hypothetical protein